MKNKPLFLGVGITGVAAATAFTIGSFRRWRQTRRWALQTGGKIAQTAHGPVEYAEMGRGPALLLCHGAPGGYDQLYMMGEIAAAGFRVICPSRPGYLRTPLASGATVAEQADALAALLDTLGVEKTAVVGASAGGPIALQITLRHPGRVWAQVMMAAVAQAYHLPEASRDALLGRLFLSESGATLLDFGMWLLELFTRYFPAASARQMIAAESTLSPAQIKAKVKAIMQDPAQVDWFRKLVSSTMPLSLRRGGLQNDLEHLANLPRYPLGSITAPTFVVHGRYDADVPYRNAEFVANAVPDARLITQEKSGHLIWLGDEWPETQRKLIRFLKKQAPV